MRILFSVITCNRLHYFKNCVNSILSFIDMDDIDLMVVDNCSIEKGYTEYLNSLPSNVIVKRFDERVPNELYRAMNYSVKFCMKNKIPIVNFIQDDYQFLYTLDSILPTVRKCFTKYPKVGQINYNMAWKRKRIGKWPVVKAAGTRFALLDDKSLVDNGFTRVKIYKKTGFYPTNVISYDQNSLKTFGFDKNRYKKIPNGELWFGTACRKLGYVRAFSLRPNQSMIFDCAYIRKDHRFGRYFPPPNEFYLKPFDQDKIDAVNRRHKKSKYCFIEKMVEPWGWEPTTLDKHNRENIINKID
jgi:hypothetical protein